ncbi:hypothetical protein B7494_g1433 [Chlorociboria aeruginascens]|nr:hypothetical protein B7494_g1433 [Chlorociboria aeruginascens]
MVEGSAEATDDKEVLEGGPMSELEQLDADDATADGLPDDGKDDEEEKEEKTEPSSRFAFSLDASFPSCLRNMDGCSGPGEGGRGLRSKGIKPAGRRVICIE